MLYETLAKDLAKRGIGSLIQFGEQASDGEFSIDPCIQKWLNAFDAFEDGDKSKLVAVLKSGQPIPDVMAPHIGDLIERWNFVRPKHRMRTPSYQLTNDDIAMNRLNCELDDLLASSGKSLSVALAEIAASWGTKASVLREYHDKRRGPDRRVKARGYKRAGK